MRARKLSLFAGTFFGTGLFSDLDLPVAVEPELDDDAEQPHGDEEGDPHDSRP
jgi:hypothetical protein